MTKTLIEVKPDVNWFKENGYVLETKDQNGYGEVWKNVNTGEWIWANAYQRTLDGVGPDTEKQATLARLRSEYVAYMLAKLAFLERDSSRPRGGPITSRRIAVGYVGRGD